jgi:hypothetical protein
MSTDTTSPTPKKPEQQQKIAPKKDELPLEQLDQVTGGGGTGTRGRVN